MTESYTATLWNVAKRARDIAMIARWQKMKDKIITCPHCIYEVKGRCELSGEYVSDNQYCDEADDGEEDDDE